MNLLHFLNIVLKPFSSGDSRQGPPGPPGPPGQPGKPLLCFKYYNVNLLTSDNIISIIKAMEDQDLKETKETRASHPALVRSKQDLSSVFMWL